MDKKLSVLTVSHNNQDTINNYLKTLLTALPEKSEVIIIDSNSTDKTVDKIRDFILSHRDSDINLYTQKENIGFGKGNNLAASKASGKYIFLLNPDTEVKSDALEKLIEFAEDHQNVGLVAPKLVQSDGKVQPSVRKLPSILGAIGEYYFGIKRMYEAYVPDTQSPVEVECVVGAAMLLRRELFLDLGGFNEEFFMYYEDIDLCKRIKDKKLKIFYLPSAEIIHQVGGSISEQKVKWIKESAMIYHGTLRGALLNVILKLRPLR